MLGEKHMAGVFDAIANTFGIFLMMGVGYYLSAKGWFNDETPRLFAKLVTGLALPCYMIANLTSAFTAESLTAISGNLVIPFMAMISAYIFSILLAKWVQVPLGRRGIFRSMIYMSNTIFVGLPVNMALFGPESLPYVLLYYAANTTMFWTLSVYEIAKDGHNGKSGRMIDTLKNIFSPPFVGFLVAVGLIFAHITLPHFIVDTCRYFGGLVTPLAMLFIGIMLHRFELSNVRINKEVMTILMGRFALAPLIMFAIAWYFQLPPLMFSVFLIQSGMPAMTQTPIIAKSYQADSEYAAVNTAMTNTVSLATIPVYIFLLNYIGII